MSAPQRGQHCLTIGIIGAGRVGSALGAALRRAGHTIAAVTATSHPHRLERRLPGVPVATAAEVVHRATGLLLLAVPDDALAPLVRQLPVPPAGPVIAHTSGAHGLAVLRPLTAAGARPLALHPAMTFTGDDGDLSRLPGSGYGVTAPAELRPFVTRLVGDLGGSPEWVAEADRPLYHAGLAHGANHLVTLVNEAADRLRRAGVTEPDRLLGPLLRAALDNALRTGDAGLTGPVVRGDADTVAAHLRALRRTAPDSVEAYRALARRTAERAVTAGRLTAPAAAPVLAALAAAGAPDQPAPPAAVSAA